MEIYKYGATIWCRLFFRCSRRLRCFSCSFVFNGTFIIGMGRHTLSSWRKGKRTEQSSATMCRLWGYQCVAFIVLRRRDFYTKFKLARLPRKEREGGNTFAIIWQQSGWNIVNILHRFLYCTPSTTYCLSSSPTISRFKLKHPWP